MMEDRSDDKCADDKARSLVWNNITFDVNVTKFGSFIHGGVPGKRRLLTNVSGAVSSGQVMAIIGPSGAGKTTLLNALALQPFVYNDDHITIGGDITFGGAPITRHFFAERCAYLPQENMLWPAMTAKENFAFSALLHGVPAGDCDSAVSSTLSSLGLESCADVAVGSPFIKGLSGGQKRRVSLGVELVGGTKDLLFLDEPTSGLDAAAAIEIMRVVTDLAKSKGVVVVCSIHQPSTQVFWEFDQLLLLSEGRTAFCGKAAEAMPHFASLGRTPTTLEINPADYLLEITNSDFANSAAQVTVLLDAWAKSSAAHPATDSSGDDHGHGAGKASGSSLARIGTLIRRAGVCYSRDPAVYLLRFAMYGFMSLFLGATYYDVDRGQGDVYDRFFCIMWTIAFFSYMGMVGLPAFSMEKAVAAKEITNGMYGLGEYCVALAIVQLPICYLLGTIASAGPYWLPGLNPDAARYFAWLGIYGMHLYVVESLGLLIAAIIPNFVLGLIVFCSALSQMFVFNGFFISVGNMPKFLIWIYYGSPFTYTTQALFKIVFTGLDMTGYDKCMAKNNGPCFGENGGDVLRAVSDSDLDYTETVPLHWFLVLLLFAVGMRVQFYLFLRKDVY